MGNCANPNSNQAADMMDMSSLKLMSSSTPMEKQLTYDKLRVMQAQLHSNIQLEATVFTKTPIKKGQYSMNYRLEYARTQSKWTETTARQFHQSKLAPIDFMFAAPSQLVTVEVDTLESEEQKLKKSFVHNVTFNQFKIVATFDLHQCLLA